jgi:hypothetical protein
MLSNRARLALFAIADNVRLAQQFVADMSGAPCMKASIRCLRQSFARSSNLADSDLRLPQSRPIPPIWRIAPRLL